MTKEVLLSNYNKDELAEICVEFYKKNEELAFKVNKLEQYENLDIWDDIEKVFEKLQFIPAKDFIELYYRMQAMINNHVRYINTCIPNYDKNGSASSHTSKPEDLRNITAIY